MIAHLDADAFFASVLKRKDPSLNGKPLLVTGMGGGCVIAASYEAKAYGVKTGMRLSDAKKLVPNFVVLPSDFKEACVASMALQDIIQKESSIVERYSVDEWFFDLNAKAGGLPRNLNTWSEILQQYIIKSANLSVSIGIAPSKLLAKMASEYKKPAGRTILYESDIEVFLKSLCAEAIPGIGRSRSIHAQARNWNTAWDIANADCEKIQKLFGKPGLEMQRELMGEYVNPIEHEKRPPKSISRCRSFRVTGNKDDLFAYVLTHLTRTLLKMRLQNLSCTKVSVWLRGDDYKNFKCAELSLPQIMATEEEILPYVKACFTKSFQKGSSYTQVGLGLLDLRPKALPQYSLFANPLQLEGCEKIQKALDSVHEKYGRDAVMRGGAMPVFKKMRELKSPTMYGEVLSCS
ncbi:MAG: hypothetical protein KAS32_11495 [Candidatus Peribacteraceae bacterium]|nr:hypothetical protein [Candidatus Peribacteraceae bacterium]